MYALEIVVVLSITCQGSNEYMEEFSTHMESLITQLKNFFINYKLPKDSEF